VFCGRGSECKALGVDETINRIDESLSTKADGLVKFDINILRLSNIQCLNFDA
jgi:hypothetical protein